MGVRSRNAQPSENSVEIMSRNFSLFLGIQLSFGVVPSCAYPYTAEGYKELSVSAF
jgi:hypothetical protein